MKILSSLLALLLLCGSSAEAISVRYRKVLSSGPLANKENFDRYIIAQKPTLFIDPDRIQTVTITSGTVSSIASRVGTYTFTQGTAANAPTLTDPVVGTENWVTYSEDFTNAAWTKVNTSVSGNTVTAAAGTASHHITQTVYGAGKNGTYTCRVDVEKGNYQFVTFGDASDGPWHVCGIDLNTGTMGTCSASGISNKSITNVSGNRYIAQFDITRQDSGAIQCGIAFGSNVNDTVWPSTTTAGTETFKVYSVQIRRTGAKPEYVATTASPKYISLSGRRTLRFDGFNDSMSSTATSANIFGASAKTGFIGLNPIKFDATNQLFNDTSSYWALYIPSAANNITWTNYDGAGDVASNSAALNRFYAANFYHDGTNIAIRLNGEAYGSAASGATTVTTGTLWLGQDGLSAKYFSGDLGPIITFNRVLPKNVMDLIQQGLRKFYRTV